jgi:hypothetical protein
MNENVGILNNKTEIFLNWINISRENIHSDSASDFSL